MKKLAVVLLVVAGVLLVAIVAAGTVFYFRFYRPFGSPMVAMAGGRALEERRLTNRAEFVPPAAGEVTPEQAAAFVAAEEAVQKSLANGAALLAEKQADLERAAAANTLSVWTVLPAFGDIRGIYLDAKVAQIDAMNRAGLSKDEFEWVRGQLYSAAGLGWSQLDVSDVAAGVRGATVDMRRFEPRQGAPEQNRRLAQPLASRLQSWAAFAFFGL
jgi:hypothetical protein